MCKEQEHKAERGTALLAAQGTLNIRPLHGTGPGVLMAAAVSMCTFRCASSCPWNNPPVPFLSAAGAKALVCDQCGAQFSKEDALETHRQTHTGTWCSPPTLHLGGVSTFGLPVALCPAESWTLCTAQAAPVPLTLKHRFRHPLVQCCCTTAQH